MIHIWPRGTAKPLPTPELNLKVKQRRYRKREEHPIRASRGIRQKGHRKEQTIGASKYSVLYQKELAQRHSKEHVASECGKEHLLNIRQSLK
jgi:hypothetical protein